jgi:hypothetical protein
VANGLAILARLFCWANGFCFWLDCRSEGGLVGSECEVVGAQAGVPVPLFARIFVLVVLSFAEAGWGARDDYGDFSVRGFFARCLGVPRMRRSL